MKEGMENPEFLKKKYDLHNKPEVESAAKRTEKREGEILPQNPKERIQNYLNRFKEIIERENPEKKERGMNALKKVLHDKFVIKEEEIPESYFEMQSRIAREQGHGDVEISNEQKEQFAEVIIADQKSSLNNWVDYLSSDDATYPDWLKYYTFRSVLGIGEYDKEEKKFAKRSKGTTKPFPDINREALAYVLDAIEKKGKGIKTDSAEFNDLLQAENFAKLYAFAIEEVTPASQEAMLSTAGEWVKYDQKSDHMPLVKSLQGHGTGWCTAGESTAQIQLQGGDFYVYYSLDEEGKPTVPRAAIRMQENKIAEIRGIAYEQNLDSNITPIIQEKLKNFGSEADIFKKKSEDMKTLTEIEKRSKKGEVLTKDNLIFLYEINNSIEGFGYQKDPRIEELLNERNKEDDMLIIFECAKEQIARDPNEINKDTKVYVGKWNPMVYRHIKQYPNIKYFYESFPKEKIFMQTIETDKNINSPEIAEEKLIEKGIYISDWGKDILYKTEFSQEEKTYKLAQFTVEQLGFPDGATTDEIYAKAKEEGLSLCPAEVGLHLRLAYKGTDWKLIAMKQISDRGGDPSVFYLDADGAELGLSGRDARPGGRWNSSARFLFLSQD